MGNRSINFEDGKGVAVHKVTDSSRKIRYFAKYHPDEEENLLELRGASNKRYIVQNLFP